MPNTHPSPLCTVCGNLTVPDLPHPEAMLHRCTGCDHCFTDQAVLEASEQYDDAYYAATHRNWFEHPHVWLFEAIRAQIARLGPAPAVLDVGCGRGDFLKHLRLREPAWILTGNDLSANEPVEGITFLRGDATQLAGDRQFDAVVNLAVIEHVEDIHEFTERLKRLCRPGGLVIVMTINDRSTLYSTARLLHRAGMSGPFNRLYSRHHLNHFNFRSLRRLVEKHGLRVRETLHHNTPMNAVDMPAAGALQTAVWRAGVRGVFAAGRVSGRTFLQTLVCESD